MSKFRLFSVIFFIWLALGLTIEFWLSCIASNQIYNANISANFRHHLQKCAISRSRRPDGGLIWENNSRKLFYKYHIKCTVHTVYTYFIIVVFQSEVCGIVIKNRKQTTIYNIFKKERLSENSLKVQFQPWLITFLAKLLASTNCNFSCNAIVT